MIDSDWNTPCHSNKFKFGMRQVQAVQLLKISSQSLGLILYCVIPVWLTFIVICHVAFYLYKFN